MPLRALVLALLALALVPSAGSAQLPTVTLPWGTVVPLPPVPTPVVAPNGASYVVLPDGQVVPLPTGTPLPGTTTPSRPTRPQRSVDVSLDGALVRTDAVATQALVFRGGAGTVTGRLIGPDGSIVAEAQATSGGGFGRGTLTFALPAAVTGALGQFGVIPLRLEITVEGAESPAVTQSTAFVAPPTSIFRLTGRKRGGGFGVERIVGTARGDDLGGMSGNDTLLGLDGNDRLNGGTGNDVLRGGPGIDESDGFDGDDRHFGGPGDDRLIESRFGDDWLFGEDGNDYLVGGRGHDRLSGGPGNDILDGSSAPDWFDCGPGEDIAIIDNQSERGPGRMKGCETVIQAPKILSRECSQGGTDQAETLLGTEGRDTCRGLGGDDDLEGRGGADRLYGGAGNDRIFGRFGNDLLDGGPGNDEIEGGRGRDRLIGGDGDDQLNGGFAADVVRGGAGDDTIVAQGGGSDLVDCGPGKDLAYADKSDRVTNCETVKRPK